MTEPKPESAELTDAEWFAFQRIPEQGYSHRAWVDARIRERMAQAWDEGKTAAFAEYGRGGEPVNPYREPLTRPGEERRRG